MPGTVFVRLCLVLITFGAKLFRLTLLAEEFTGYLTNSDDRMVFILRMSNKVLMLLVRFCCVLWSVPIFPERYYLAFKRLGRGEEVLVGGSVANDSIIVSSALRDSPKLMCELSVAFS